MDNIKSYRIKKTTLIIAISIIFSILLFNILFDQKDKKIREFVVDKETEFVKEQPMGIRTMAQADQGHQPGPNGGQSRGQAGAQIGCRRLSPLHWHEPLPPGLLWAIGASAPFGGPGVGSGRRPENDQRAPPICNDQCHSRETRFSTCDAGPRAASSLRNMLGTRFPKNYTKKTVHLVLKL